MIHIGDQCTGAIQRQVTLSNGSSCLVRWLPIPLCIVPLFKEYFGDSRTEGECRLMACEVVTFLQMMFCRADEMLRFAGVDIRSKKDRDGIIDAQMDLFLGRE